MTPLPLYLSLGFFPGPSTPLRGVSKLLPAHSLVIQNSSVRTEPYWTLPYPDAKTSESDERQLAAELLAELEEAVRVRLMSDVPLGAMLSGGLDSSVVVALMARNMDQPVKTFSVGFVEDERNELADARLVADRFATDHHELELSYHEEAISLPDLLWHLDEPLADLSALGFHAISRLASREVTVALCGQGADELLGGYPAHRNAALAGVWSRAPAVVRRAGKQRSAACASACPPRGHGGHSRRSGRALRGPSEQAELPAASSWLFRGSCRACRQGRSSGSDRGSLSWSRQRSFGGNALPVPTTWAGRRHAPLLLSRIDGQLSGGASAVPRPQARRVLCNRAETTSRCGASSKSDCYVLPQRVSSPIGSSRNARSDSSIRQPPAGYVFRRTAWSPTTCCDRTLPTRRWSIRREWPNSSHRRPIRRAVHSSFHCSCSRSGSRSTSLARFQRPSDEGHARTTAGSSRQASVTADSASTIHRMNMIWMNPKRSNVNIPIASDETAAARLGRANCRRGPARAGRTERVCELLE